MSGICAIVNFDGAPVDETVLRAMADACANRGPDGIYCWIDGNVGLAHLALHSTPEAIRERQPLLSSDRQLCLVADARVDNRPEMIHLLSDKGLLKDNDPTDADLILAAYRCWGEDCPAQIIGDYAFAIWDSSRRSLFSARDALGIKTLHYARVGAALLVASEAQQILCHPEVPKKLDEVSVGQFLVKSAWDDERSLFENVHRLPMAHTLVAEPSGTSIRRYWDIDPDFRTSHRTDAGYAEHFLDIFRRAVADRLRTNAPVVGITMSGGLDSTSVGAVSQKILVSQNDHPHLLACSYIFDHLKECDEREYSSKVASDLGIELVYINGEDDWLLDHDQAYIPSLETPFMANESRTRKILEIFSQRQAGVWLTGHGGDNLLTGTPIVSADRLRRGDLRAVWNMARYWRTRYIPLKNLYNTYRDSFVKPLILPALRRLLGRNSEPVGRKRAAFIPPWLDADFISRTRLVDYLRDHPAIPSFKDHARPLNYASMVQLTAFLPPIHWSERRAATFHMEARHPFLDRRLVEFMLSIPQDQLYRDGQTKYILRNAMKGILPESVRMRRDKAAFNQDVAIGLQEREPEKVLAILAKPLSHPYNVIVPEEIIVDYRLFLEGKNTFSIKYVWQSIAMKLWLLNNLAFFSIF